MKADSYFNRQSKGRRAEGDSGRGLFVGWLAGCLTSQQQASVSQGRICSDNLTCCHTEIEVADQTFYLTQSQYTDTGPTSPSADPITPGAWQGSHWSTQFLSHWYDSTPKKSRRKRDSNPGPSALEADALTTRPTRRSVEGDQNSRQLGDNILISTPPPSPPPPAISFECLWYLRGNF